MILVKVSMSIRGRDVALSDIKDANLKSALKKAGDDLARKLAKITCPEHAKGPTNVRMHFNPSGAGDLKYDSCCEKLGAAIGAELT